MGTPWGTSRFDLLGLFGERTSLLIALPHGADVRAGELGPAGVLAAQEPAGQRHPREDAEVLSQARGEDLVLGVALDAVVDRLNRLGPDLGRTVHLPDTGVLLADGDAQMADGPGGDQSPQLLPQSRRLEQRIRAAVELVKIDVVRPQGLERLLQLLLDLRRLEHIIPLERRVEPMAELGGDDPLVALTLDRPADELLPPGGRRSIRRCRSD